MNPVDDNPVMSSGSGDIDFRELGRTIWSGRLRISLFTIIFLAAGLAYALLAPQMFRAEAVLGNADKKSVPTGIGQLGGLANLAGINIGVGSTQEPVAVLRSRGFAREFIEKRGLMPVLLEDEISSGDPVDIRDAVTKFVEEVRGISEDRKNGLVTLTVEWRDPKVAADWANSMVDLLNDRMRTKSLEESERNVVYLQKEIASTQLVSLQQSLGRVLETELQKLMLARGNEEFAFKIIDPAVAPKLRSSPRRTMVVAFSLIIGLFAGIAFELGSKMLRSSSAKLRIGAP